MVLIEPISNCFILCQGVPGQPGLPGLKGYKVSPNSVHVLVFLIGGFGWILSVSFVFSGDPRKPRSPRSDWTRGSEGECGSVALTAVLGEQVLMGLSVPRAWWEILVLKASLGALTSYTPVPINTSDHW